jgi:nicotinate-nucleotide adenylyltransferase
MNIGIFGGTFDPPHLGHLTAAERVLDAGLAEEVWFIPCLAHRLGKSPADFSHRLAMCRLLINGRAGMRVSDIEASVNRPGYTIDLVHRLMQDHPEHRFRLVAGTDIYHQKDKWHRYDEIAALAPPIFIARRGEAPIPEPVLKAPPGISSESLRAALARGESPSDKMPPAVIEYIRDKGLYRSKSP